MGHKHHKRKAQHGIFAKSVKLVSGGQLSRMYECRIGIKNGVLWIFYTVNTILVPP